jgi:cytochrome b subunit of formate dehydrogenase
MPARAVTESPTTTTQPARPTTYRISQTVWMLLAALGGLLLLVSGIVSDGAGPLLATATPVTSLAVLVFAAAAVFAVVAWVLRRASLEDEQADEAVRTAA